MEAVVKSDWGLNVLKSILPNWSSVFNEKMDKIAGTVRNSNLVRVPELPKSSNCFESRNNADGVCGIIKLNSSIVIDPRLGMSFIGK